jgi:small subunit ribosomal protein S1
VKILRVDTTDRKIGLSLKRAQWGDTTGSEGEVGSSEGGPTPDDMPQRGGMDSHDAMGTDKIQF